ncbi:histidine phosphatase family protein [Lacisediminimonas profundi]|uniref:histidine phosphatase family protein n=1 Tax=Lacisediminimonas profundi TaxID=2603856 RepID=UPI00124B5E12|nr:histidine phosphatase family protein [Lacisediminimonas profundi]
MTELILIRHGETAWNTEKRLQGHIDIPLNDEGRRQAQAVAAALAGTRADRVIASDLGRALDTAGPIARNLGLAVDRDRRLRERSFGAFEGLQHDEIRDRFPDAWRQWQAREPDARYPGGEREAETLSELAGRVRDALASIAGTHQGGRVILITHGGFLDCAYRLATGMAMNAARNFDVRNASINRFGWHADAGLQLLEWGAVDHLAASLDEVAR